MKSHWHQMTSHDSDKNVMAQLSLVYLNSDCAICICFCAVIIKNVILKNDQHFIQQIVSILWIKKYYMIDF